MISVIIPMYNSENYIAECLSSVVLQDYSDIEVIVIDDGSTDNSAGVVADFQQKDNRIKLLRQENHGLVYSRKQGVQNASGEYILFVDSDDSIDRNMISSLVDIAVADNADVVASAATIFINENKRIARNAATDGLYQKNELDELKRKLFCYEDFSTMAVLPFLWNKLWRTDLIRKYVLSADEKMTIGEDVAIGFPAIYEAKMVAITNQSFYNYRKTESSMLNRKKNVLKEVENLVSVYKNIRRVCADNGTDEYLAEGINRFVLNQLFTRAYPYVTGLTQSKGLFPYCDDIPKNLIIYGAGELGREIYNYASSKVSIKYWIDKDSENLREFGLPVNSIDQCDIDENDIVIIAVLSKRATEGIVSDLFDKGYRKDSILKFDLDDDIAHDLITKTIGD